VHAAATVEAESTSARILCRGARIGAAALVTRPEWYTTAEYGWGDRRLWEHEGVRGDRRLLAVATVAAIVAAPAIVLQALCVGRSCERSTAASAGTPFCTLPGTVREGIAAGYRDGRSPDVLAVTAEGSPVGGPGGP
jgi:hypothetical protein